MWRSCPGGQCCHRGPPAVLLPQLSSPCRRVCLPRRGEQEAHRRGSLRLPTILEKEPSIQSVFALQNVTKMEIRHARKKKGIGARQMEIYLGTIALFAANFDPVGWVECDGRTLSIQENQALYALVGTTYGGDGNRTFALPDLRKQVPIEGMRYAIAVQGAFPSRS
jgi:hypothetical protein